MQKFEILPTDDNLISALRDNLINRNKDLVLFYELLLAQTGACAIAIDGRWGSGKTFFVKQMQLLINAMNSFSGMDEKLRDEVIYILPFTKEQRENDDGEIAVYFDAWENDNDTNPVIAIVYEIAKQLGIEYKIENRDFFRIAGSIIEAISGRNVNGILDALKDEDPLTKLKQQKEVTENIKQFLSESMSERGNRLVVFIDELDRCKPSYAVHLLEQIKHYLNDERITFVFTVNLEELQHTIKHYYGDDFDACRYLDRFFDLRMGLPPADIRRFYDSLGMNGTGTYEYVCKRVVKMFNFELREITRFYNQAKVAAYKPTHTEGRGFDFSFPDGQGKQLILLYIVPLLIGLRMVSITEYDAFVNGENSEPLHRLFDSKDMAYYVFDHLLARDESFEKTDGKKLVTQKELINRVYDAIFVETYTGRAYSITLGDYSFSASSKEFALAVASAFSGYADYR